MSVNPGAAGPPRTTSRGTARVTTPADTDILITREFAAPRALVWRTYTTSELVKRWWPGKRGEAHQADIDLRPGGHWRYMKIESGGFEVAFHGVFAAVDPEVRVVKTEVFEGLPDAEQHASLATTTLTDLAGRTHMEMLCRYRDQADRDAVLRSGMEVCMQESMDELDQVAASL